MFRSTPATLMYICLLGATHSCVVLLSSHAEARFVKAMDLAAVSELERAEIEVDKLGRSRVTIDRVVRIVNDEGRERESLQSVDSNDRTSILTILLAETINGKTHIEVAKKNIEVKPVGDFSRNFDTTNRAKINFPQVKIGSKIHLRYRIDVHEVPNEGFWSFLADFNGWYMENYEATIRSELPLFTWKNDPEGVFSFAASQSSGRALVRGVASRASERKNTKNSARPLYTLKIRSLKPIIRLTTQEESSFIRAERSSSFVVTTLTDWHKYAGLTIQRQERLLDQRLPPSMERIYDAALKEHTPLEKLNRVAALISRDFRYFGDWRHRNGGYLPRPLSEIHATHYGDCKDLSLTAVAIYRALGFDADLVWTIRGDPHTRPNRAAYAMPVDWFNHAITRVQIDGTVYWIDPTNPVADAALIPADISGKPAFVLNEANPRLEFTPELKASESSRHWEFVYEYLPNHTFHVSGKIILKGRSAVSQATNIVYKPIDTVRYDLLRILSFGRKIAHAWLGELPQATRIVQDMETQFRFDLEEGGVRTSAGYGFLLTRESPVDRLLDDVADRVSDVYLDPPVVLTSREELVGVRRVGHQNLNCELKTDWISLTRNVVDTLQGVIINDRVEITANFVPNEALKTAKFEKFQNDLRECFYRAAVIFEPVEHDLDPSP